MRNKTLALLIILQVIRARSTSPSSATNCSNEMVDEKIGYTVRNHEEATMMSSLVGMNRSRNEESEMYAQQQQAGDCATNAMFGKFSSGAQYCTKEKRIEPIKNLGKIFWIFSYDSILWKIFRFNLKLLEKFYEGISEGIMEKKKCKLNYDIFHYENSRE